VTPAAAAFLRRAAIFGGIGLVLYAGLYASAESLVRSHADRNRFFRIATTEPTTFDYVIMGASHAAVFDYQDMNAQLEQATGARILNLAEVGSGVTMSRVLLDYFFTRHSTQAVVYVLDSFIFYSTEWNEDRLRDASLFVRAPFDPGLFRVLMNEPSARATAFEYLGGFPKINNKDRFAADTFPDAGARFERSYRPVPQVDRQRISYLYPEQVDAALFERYLAEFEALVRSVRDRGARFIVIRPPIPERVRQQLPDEDGFDKTLRGRLAPLGVEWHDFSRVSNDEKFFYDTDHLNRQGALNFVEQHLAAVLR